MLSLHTIAASRGTRQKRKIVGRGNASGHGTYSTRGVKGQKARSGVSGLKRLGMKKQLLQIPKSRGFHSIQPKNQVVSVSALNKHFKSGDLVSPATLLEKKLINSLSAPVKILGKEKLAVSLKFDKIKMSAGVKSQVK